MGLGSTRGRVSLWAGLRLVGGSHRGRAIARGETMLYQRPLRCTFYRPSSPLILLSDVLFLAGMRLRRRHSLSCARSRKWPGCGNGEKVREEHREEGVGFYGGDGGL